MEDQSIPPMGRFKLVKFKVQPENAGNALADPLMYRDAQRSVSPVVYFVLGRYMSVVAAQLRQPRDLTGPSASGWPVPTRRATGMDIRPPERDLILPSLINPNAIKVFSANGLFAEGKRQTRALFFSQPSTAVGSLSQLQPALWIHRALFATQGGGTLA
ncbi:hypothetical protein BDM02DRAFT_3107826 [Thelephora ganbajun]|uniref:Uncharacterized protein n=1 Tax=Thelephora ganbajun TaxID=370292 RepID=A0ACB6ZVC2_THEGA|nr:hypothetical protein BDM02DRAFT_3107826 [Thelephora ganbajun]